MREFISLVAAIVALVGIGTISAVVLYLLLTSSLNVSIAIFVAWSAFVFFVGFVLGRDMQI